MVPVARDRTLLATKLEHIDFDDNLVSGKVNFEHTPGLRMYKLCLLFLEMCNCSTHCVSQQNACIFNYESAKLVHTNPASYRM